MGVDGSKHSRHALEWAVREAAVRHAPLAVLAVHQAVAGYWGGPVPYPGDPELAKVSLEQAEKEVHSVLEEAGPDVQPSTVTVRAVTGLPAEELLSAAKGADLLVVGSRGAGGFKRLLLGSVSTQATHHAHCPVVVVPAGRA